MISRLELAEIIGERTLRQPIDTLKDSVAAYLLEESSVDELDSLMRDVLAYRAAHGYVEATIFSAHPLSNEVRGDLQALLKDEYPTAKKISINETIEPSVVGGIRIELAGRELDLTVKAKLNTFKRLTAARKD